MLDLITIKFTTDFIFNLKEWLEMFQYLFYISLTISLFDFLPKFTTYIFQKTIVSIVEFFQGRNNFKYSY